MRALSRHSDWLASYPTRLAYSLIDRPHYGHCGGQRARGNGAARQIGVKETGVECAIDLDEYSSTVSALRIFEVEQRHLLPMVACYSLSET